MPAVEEIALPAIGNCQRGKAGVLKVESVWKSLDVNVLVDYSRDVKDPHTYDDPHAGAVNQKVEKHRERCKVHPKRANNQADASHIRVIIYVFVDSRQDLMAFVFNFRFKVRLRSRIVNERL